MPSLVEIATDKYELELESCQRNMHNMQYIFPGYIEEDMQWSIVAAIVGRYVHECPYTSADYESSYMDFTDRARLVMNQSGWTTETDALCDIILAIRNLGVAYIKLRGWDKLLVAPEVDPEEEAAKAKEEQEAMERNYADEEVTNENTTEEEGVEVVAVTGEATE